jgi:hypothetical protein
VPRGQQKAAALITSLFLILTVIAPDSGSIESTPSTVTHSPIDNHTILIKLKDHGEKQRVGELLLEIPVCELHCIMVLAKAEVGGLAVVRDDFNKISISDTMLWKIIKKGMPQVKKATYQHK